MNPLGSLALLAAAIVTVACTAASLACTTLNGRPFEVVADVAPGLDPEAVFRWYASPASGEAVPA